MRPVRIYEFAVSLARNDVVSIPDASVHHVAVAFAGLGFRGGGLDDSGIFWVIVGVLNPKKGHASSLPSAAAMSARACCWIVTHLKKRFLMMLRPCKIIVNSKVKIDTTTIAIAQKQFNDNWKKADYHETNKHPNQDLTNI
jgi:hypothetical protein